MPGEASPEYPDQRFLSASGATPLASLSAQQREVADAVCNVLGSRTHVTASVVGMTCTGKTRVLQEVSARIERAGRKAILLSPNRRIAETQDDGRFRSIYRHLYLDPESDDQSSAGEGGPGANTEKQKGAIELGACADPADCVYLVDGAHLLGNSLFLTPDGCTYGSGKLLDDLFDFASIPASDRQLIFFGDPYQIQRASAAESVLSGSFQAGRDISHLELKLERPDGPAPLSTRLHNALLLVEAIDAGDFSSLEPAEDDEFRIIGAETAATELAARFADGDCSTRLVTETHSQVSKFVRWLRPRLFGSKSPASVEPGELLEVYAAFAGSAPGTGQEVFAGQRLRVAKIGKRFIVRQELNGRS